MLICVIAWWQLYAVMDHSFQDAAVQRIAINPALSLSIRRKPRKNKN